MKNSTRCPLPWIHLATHPIGEVSVCCRSDMKNSSGHAKNDKDQHTLKLSSSSIQEVRNSDTFRKIRMQMLSNEVPEACHKCFEDEENGIVSKRVEELKKYPLSDEHLQKITQLDGTINEPLQYLELRLGNQCNLKCTTCNPTSSSQWKKDAIVLKENFKIQLAHDYTSIEEDLFKWADQESFWNELELHNSSIKEIYINGGEPTLNLKHLKYLSKLIEQKKASRIKLIYNTNMIYITEELINLWGKFSHVTVKASIDDINLRNDYLRFPSMWKKVEDSFKSLLGLDFEIHIMQTISCFNFLYLEELYSWVSTISPKTKIHYNFVTDPEYFSPFIIPPEERKKAIQSYEHLPFLNHYQLTKKYFNNTFHQDQVRLFLKNISALDTIRGTDFKKTFPKLYETLIDLG